MRQMCSTDTQHSPWATTNITSDSSQYRPAWVYRSRSWIETTNKTCSNTRDLWQITLLYYYVFFLLCSLRLFALLPIQLVSFASFIHLLRLSFGALVACRIPVDSYNGSVLRLTRLERKQMGAYLCIASNDVPPAVSKRVSLNVHCEYILYTWIEYRTFSYLSWTFSHAPMLFARRLFVPRFLLHHSLHSFWIDFYLDFLSFVLVFALFRSISLSLFFTLYRSLPVHKSNGGPFHNAIIFFSSPCRACSGYGRTINIHWPLLPNTTHSMQCWRNANPIKPYKYSCAIGEGTKSIAGRTIGLRRSIELSGRGVARASFLLAERWTDVQ